MSISLAAFYYISTLRNAQRTQQLQLETRQLDLYMKWQMELTKPEVMKNFNEVNMLEWEDFDDFARKYSDNVNPEDAEKRFATWCYWNSLGYLLSKGVIDADAVFWMTGNWCIHAWNKFEPIIRGFRERDRGPENWIWFEYLADEMKKVREQKGMSEYTPPWRPE